jgi:hypothetical protein
LRRNNLTRISWSALGLTADLKCVVKEGPESDAIPTYRVQLGNACFGSRAGSPRANSDCLRRTDSVASAAALGNDRSRRHGRRSVASGNRLHRPSRYSSSTKHWFGSRCAYDSRVLNRKRAPSPAAHDAGMSIGPLIAAESQALSWQLQGSMDARESSPSRAGGFGSAAMKTRTPIGELLVMRRMTPAPGSQSFPRSPERLMIIFGEGALTCGTKCSKTAFSRLTKVTQPPSRRGHRRRRVELFHAGSRRGLLNMTVKELAARARVATDTIVRLENGADLKPCTVCAIRSALESAGVEFLPAGVRFKSGPRCGWAVAKLGRRSARIVGQGRCDNDGWG